jgi:hypothetical protein
MAWQLRDGVSFCDAGDRLVFLDRRRDRYFCLTTDAEHSVRRLIAGEVDNGEDAKALGRLARNGLLRPGNSNLHSCEAGRRPDASLLDEPYAPTSMMLMLASIWQIVRVPCELKLLGLDASLGRTERAKHSARGGSLATARSVATAFRRLASIFSGHDQCLARSIALARVLIARGCRAEVVLGVKLRPFKAHCWVQLDEHLVNERWDVTRAFTPIFIL